MVQHHLRLEVDLLLAVAMAEHQPLAAAQVAAVAAHHLETVETEVLQLVVQMLEQVVAAGVETEVLQLIHQ
jgi:hypothetical protein